MRSSNLSIPKLGHVHIRKLRIIVNKIRAIDPYMSIQYRRIISRSTQADRRKRNTDLLNHGSMFNSIRNHQILKLEAESFHLS